MQKRGIDQVSHLPWGGSSASPSPRYVTNVARSLSLGSIRSHVPRRINEDWIEAEEGDDVDWVGLERYETPLKPLRTSTGGKLPGLDGRVQMAKLASNVSTHIFAPNEQITWTMAREGWSPNEIPVLFPALKSLDGPVTSLLHTLPTKEIMKPSS